MPLLIGIPLLMKTNQEISQSGTARVGWGILLGVSALLFPAGIFGYIEFPAFLGLLALLVALEGYRNGTRWAWRMMWVPVAAFAALTGVFRLLTGESYALSFGILSFAIIMLVGLLLARKGLAG